MNGPRAYRPCAAALLAARLLSGAPAPAAQPDLEPPAPIVYAGADEVLARVRAVLYTHPVLLRGELLKGRARGKLDRIAFFDAHLDFTATPPRAEYTLSDAFGAPTEQLTLVQAGAGVWRRTYACGRPLEPAPAPPGEALIAGSDVAWNDLSLAFLWWTGGVLAGRERFLERDCLVLEFAPPRAPRLTRLWIDERWLLLIKLEEFDAAGHLARRVSVRTFKKVEDTWFIKDLDVRRWPGNHRTLIRLTDASVADAPEPETPSFPHPVPATGNATRPFQAGRKPGSAPPA